jgi:TonB family protein
MLVRSVIVVSGLLAASAVFAQASEQKAAQNAINWEVFQKLYPPRAIAAHEEGAVGFVVTLDSKGAVTNCEVTHTSGHPLLDQETCKIVTMNAVFNADPGLSPSQVRRHEGLINWKLPASATVLAPPKPVTALAAPEKMVCKKNLKAGTLSGYERICMTPTEWAKQSDDQKQPYADMQGKKGFTNEQIGTCMNPNGC